MMLCLQAKMPREGTWVMSYIKILLSPHAPPHPTYLSPSEQFAIEVEEIFQKNSYFKFSFRGKNGNYPKNQFWIVQLIPTKEGHGLIMSEA